MAKVNLAALAATDVTDSEPRSARPAGVTELPIEKIATNPLNKRTERDENPTELEEMARTIRVHGVLQPLVVATASAFLAAYPDQTDSIGDARWVTLIGNRRLTAARDSQHRHVPAVVNDGQLGSMFEVMLVENGHRRDLAPLREAEAMRLILDQEKLKQSELAHRIGRTEAYVTQRLHLLRLIAPLRAALDAGTLTVETGRDLGRLPEPDQEAIAASGPPFRSRALNAVKTRRPRARSLPTGDPAAAARSIRELYSGDELAELIQLLQSDDVSQPARSDSGGR